MAPAFAAPSWASAQDDQNPPEPQPDPEPKLQEESPFRFYFKNEIFFESDDGSFKGQIGGRVQHDSIAQKADSEITGGFNGDPVDQNRFRRARVFLNGFLHERFEFKIEGDFAQSGSFADVYLKLKNFPFSDTTFGHFKEPIGLEQLMEAGSLFLMERNLVNALVPGLSAGVMVNGTFLDARGTYAVGPFRDADRFGDSADPTVVTEWDGVLVRSKL